MTEKKRLKKVLVERKCAPRLFVADVLTWRAPGSLPLRQDLRQRKVTFADLEIEAVSVLFNPLVPIWLTSVPLFVLVKSCQRLAESALAEPRTVHFRVLQNSRDVV